MKRSLAGLVADAGFCGFEDRVFELSTLSR